MSICLEAADYFGRPSLPVAVFRRECGINTLPHRHPFHEVVLVIEGSGVNAVDGRLCDFKAGDLLLVRAGQTHHFRQVRALRSITVMILPQCDRGRTLAAELSGWLEELFASTKARAGVGGHVTLAAHEFARALSLMERMETSLLGGSAFHDAEAMDHFASLMRFLAARLHRRRCSWARARVIRGFGEAEARLAPALAHIERYFTERLKLEELAARACESTRTLLREFQVVTGRSPVAYLHGMRLHHALLQLRHTDKQVVDVAYDVGFNDLSFFNYKFRELIGQSPTAWRQRRSHEW